jgi:beta-glucuronidase
VANELSIAADHSRGTRAFLTAARAKVRRLDPSVPASVDMLSYPRIPRQSVYAAFPLLGVTSYFGWYTGKPGHSLARLADLRPYLREFHALYRASAVVVTEFGAEAFFDGPATVKGSYAFQSRFVRDTIRIIDRSAVVSGAIYWTLRDFPLKPSWDGGGMHPANSPLDTINNKGLLGYDGRRKPAWRVAAERFARIPGWIRPAAVTAMHAATSASKGATTGTIRPSSNAT